MLKFHIIPASKVPQKQTTSVNSLPPKTLDEKFAEFQKIIWVREHRKLREFHFVAIEHEGFMIVMNGNKKIFGKIEINGDKRKAIIKARAEIYVEAIRGNEETDGGCYFDDF